VRRPLIPVVFETESAEDHAGRADRRPPWRDNVSTIAGSPFASVRLLPMNSTRPLADSPLRGVSPRDGATDDELQLVTTAAATMTLTTEFLTPSARVIGYCAPCRHPRGRWPCVVPGRGMLLGLAAGSWLRDAHVALKDHKYKCDVDDGDERGKERSAIWKER
jgi:hypothetical protein